MPTCKCGNELPPTESIEYAGVQIPVIHVAGAYLTDCHGFCDACGRGYHYSIGTYRLVELLRLSNQETKGQ